MRSDGRSSSGLAWLLVAVLAVGLLIAGVGLWYLLPKSSPNDPNALPRETSPKGPLDADEREAVDLFKNAKESVVNVDTVVLRRNLDRSVEAVQAGTGSGFV